MMRPRTRPRPGFAVLFAALTAATPWAPAGCAPADADARSAVRAAPHAGASPTLAQVGPTGALRDRRATGPAPAAATISPWAVLAPTIVPFCAAPTFWHPLSGIGRTTRRLATSLVGYLLDQHRKHRVLTKHAMTACSSLKLP